VKYPNQLGGRQPIIRRADLAAAGIYYRALVGPFASAEKAARLCSALKLQAGTASFRKIDASRVPNGEHWQLKTFATQKLVRHSPKRDIVPSTA
jgi:SPOR domain